MVKLVPKSSVTDAIVRRDTTQIRTGKGPCAGGARSWRDTVERLGALRKAAPTSSWKRQGSILPQGAQLCRYRNSKSSLRASEKVTHSG